MCKVLPLEFGLQECNRCHSYGSSGWYPSFLFNSGMDSKYVIDTHATLLCIPCNDLLGNSHMIHDKVFPGI